MKISVGGRELIASAVLHVPEGEDAWLEFRADTWDVRLNLKFVDNDEKAEATFTLEGKTDNGVYGLMTFNNLNNGLPVGISQPFLLGDNGGRKVYFLFTGYALKGLKRLEISFFWEK